MSSKVEKAVETKQSSYVVRGVGAITLLFAPILYIFIRFECYKFVSKMAFSGWGIIGFILLGVAIYVVLQYVVFGGKWAYWKQIVKGITKITLPCLITYFVFQSSADFLKELNIVVIMLGVCWTSAYILNPLPEKQYNEGITEQMDIVSYALKKRK